MKSRWIYISVCKWIIVYPIIPLRNVYTKISAVNFGLIFLKEALVIRQKQGQNNSSEGETPRKRSTSSFFTVPFFLFLCLWGFDITFPWSRQWGQGTQWPPFAGKWWGPACSCPGSVPAWSVRSWWRSRRWWRPLPPSASTAPCILHSTSQQSRQPDLQCASCSVPEQTAIRWLCLSNLFWLHVMVL